MSRDGVLCDPYGGLCAQTEWRAGARLLQHPATKFTLRIVALGGSGLIGSKLVHCSTISGSFNSAASFFCSAGVMG